MLRIEQISKQFSGFALKDICLHIPKGYLCGLVGENGAGKTSLMKVLSGLYKADSGEYKVNGLSFNQHEAEIKNQLGLILEDSLFEKYLTLKQIGKFYGSLYTSFQEEIYLQYLKRFHLQPEQRLKTLSKGMEIKFQLAFAMSHDAKLYLFDEPTAGLDKTFREEFLAICSDILSDGERSILISTHITNDLDRMADYLAYMQKGELLFCKQKDKLCERFAMVRAENYKLKLLPERLLVHLEEGEYSGSALIIKDKWCKLDSAYQLQQPNVQELIYYLVKGGAEHAKDIVKTYL